MTGVRVYGKPPHRLQPGEYGRWVDDGDGDWYACCSGDHDLVANLSAHQVVEHEDGTITVSPSILCSDGNGGHSWHGFLKQGIWSVA